MSGEVGTKTVSPITERPPPRWNMEGMFSGFEGTIGYKFYLHIIPDNLFRWPKVKEVESTSFAKLKPALERSFGMVGISEKMIHYGGPLYNRQK